jgi:hypothetical protein
MAIGMARVNLSFPTVAIIVLLANNISSLEHDGRSISLEGSFENAP